MADYSKWDQMARDEDAAEQRAKELKRAQNRNNYFKEQEEKKIKYMQEQKEKNKVWGPATRKIEAASNGHSHSSAIPDAFVWFEI